MSKCLTSHHRSGAVSRCELRHTRCGRSPADTVRRERRQAGASRVMGCSPNRSRWALIMRDRRSLTMAARADALARRRASAPGAALDLARLTLLSVLLGGARAACPTMPCTAGNYCVLTQGVCTGCTCSPGFSSTSTASSACAGTSTTCTACPAGSTCGGWNQQAVACPLGTYLSTGGGADVTACQPCAAGRYGGSTAQTASTCRCLRRCPPRLLPVLRCVVTPARTCV